MTLDRIWGDYFQLTHTEEGIQLRFVRETTSDELLNSDDDPVVLIIPYGTDSPSYFVCAVFDKTKGCELAYNAAGVFITFGTNKEAVWKHLTKRWGTTVELV